MKAICRFLLVFFLFSTNLWADNSSWYTQDKNKKITLNVTLFLSSTCPHCHKADAFFSKLERKSPWLKVTRYLINEDKNALTLFSQRLAEQHANDFSVPAVFFCDSRWVGFAAPDTTGKILLNSLNYCKTQIEKKGTLTTATVNVLRSWANAYLFDSSMTKNPGTAKYITVMALMDAFNPCALFCLGGFFALLFIQGKRQGQALSALFFIITFELVHLGQQLHTNIFFELLPYLRWLAALTGLLTFYLAGQYYRKNKNSSLFFLLAILLAISLQSFQQTCLLNWSYIFEQWLHNQHLATEQENLYQFIYQSIYLTPLLLTFILYILVVNSQRMTNLKEKLKFIGLIYLLIIGVLLITYPWILANLSLSILTIVASLFAGLFLSKRRDV